MRMMMGPMVVVATMMVRSTGVVTTIMVRGTGVVATIVVRGTGVMVAIMVRGTGLGCRQGEQHNCQRCKNDFHVCPSSFSCIGRFFTPCGQVA
jgi:hypothetical protein